MHTPSHSGGKFRGISANADVGLGTGGNQVVNSKSGQVPGGGMVGTWQPTILYLVGLLFVEWAVFLVLSKFI
jgi:hypothetical protein